MKSLNLFSFLVLVGLGTAVYAIGDIDLLILFTFLNTAYIFCLDNVNKEN